MRIIYDYNDSNSAKCEIRAGIYFLSAIMLQNTGNTIKTYYSDRKLFKQAINLFQNHIKNTNQ